MNQNAPIAIAGIDVNFCKNRELWGSRQLHKIPPRKARDETAPPKTR